MWPAPNPEQKRDELHDFGGSSSSEREAMACGKQASLGLTWETQLVDRRTALTGILGFEALNAVQNLKPANRFSRRTTLCG